MATCLRSVTNTLTKDGRGRQNKKKEKTQESVPFSDNCSLVDTCYVPKVDTPKQSVCVLFFPSYPNVVCFPSNCCRVSINPLQSSPLSQKRVTTVQCTNGLCLNITKTTVVYEGGWWWWWCWCPSNE